MPNELKERLKITLEETASRVRRLRRKVSNDLWRIRHEKKFHSQVEPDKEREQNEKAEAFSAEFLDFIFQDISGTLAPLHPKEDQLAMFYHLKNGLSEEAEGTVDQLVLKDTVIGQYKPTGEYFIGKTYKVGSLEPDPNEGVIESLFSMMRQKYSSYHTNWSVDRDYPMMGDVYGLSGVESLKSIRFLFFEEVPTKEEVVKVIGSHDTEKVSADVYENGKRIIVRHEYEYDGQTQIMTCQYYALGSFEGTDTAKKYLVYGMNEGNSTTRQVQKQTSTEQVGAFSTVTSRI